MMHKLAVNMSSSTNENAADENSQKEGRKLITASTCDCMLFLGTGYGSKEELKKWLVFSMRECREVLDHE